MSEKWTISREAISFTKGKKEESFPFEKLSREKFQELLERAVKDAVAWFRENTGE